MNDHVLDNSQQENVIWEIKVRVADKEQYVSAMTRIEKSLYNGKGALLLALVCLIILILSATFASHSSWGQFGIVGSLIVILFSLVIGIWGVWGVRYFKSYVLKSSEKIQYPADFLYQFKTRGIYTRNQDLEDYFGYEFFSGIGVADAGIQFVFCPKDTKLGKQIRKKYKIDSFWLPFVGLSQQEIDEHIHFMRELQTHLGYIKFDKSLRKK